MIHLVRLLSVTLVGLAACWGGKLDAQAFQIAPTQIEITVAPGFNHASVRVPITGAAAGLSASSDVAWIAPTVDEAASEVVLTFTTRNLVNSLNTGTVTVTGNGTTDSFFVKAAVAPLNIVKLEDDPSRSRTYGIHQNSINAGAIVVIDPLSNTAMASITVGRKPADLAVSRNGAEMLVINSVDESISVIDLATLRVTETIALAAYDNWGVNDTTADVAYGPGSTILYTDGSWAPVLRVFDRVTRQVLQTVVDDGNGIGDFALSPDGTSLFAWAQYGWSAGWAGSYIIEFSVGAQGMLTFSKRTYATYPTVLERDPLDTPVLIDGAGERVFVKQLAVNRATITETDRVFPKAVYAISPGGEVASTDSAIFDASTGVNLLALPANTNVQAITSDYARLVYFNRASRTLETIDLLAAIGPEVLNRHLSPADGAITLPPTELSWTPLPGVDRYRIYLGTSESDVGNATTDSPLYLGEVLGPRIALTETLLPGTRYFWRIDAVNASEVVKGVIYDFTVSVIGTDRSKIATATVQGHAAHQVKVQLTSETPGRPWQASASQPWVKFENSTGTTPGTLTVVLDASQLSAGTHTATVSISSGDQNAFTLPLTLEVDPLAVKVIESEPTSALVYAISEQTMTGGSTGRAYLLEIDTAAKLIKRVVRVGTSATDLAVHPADGRVYVTNWLPGSLLAIDKTTFEQVQAYGFSPFQGTGYGDGDVYRIAAGNQGRLVVEEEDQWIDISIFDTVNGRKLTSAFVREGGGEFAPGGRFYYHGDNNSSGAEIHKFDIIGDVWTELAHVRVESASYYGSRTVVVSGDGERVFWNGGVLDKNLVIQWLIGTEIFATTADGKLAFGEELIYDTVLKRAVLGMPTATKVSAYNGTSDRLVVQVGTSLKFFNVGNVAELPAPVLSIEGVTETTVGLVWTDESLETGFTLQWRQVGATEWDESPTTLPQNSTRFSVGGLMPRTNYEFRIKAESSTYSSGWSAIVAATTLDGSQPRPDIATGVATQVTATSALLNGSVNPRGSATLAWFEYGTTTDYGSMTETFGAGSGTTTNSWSRQIHGLAPNTTYHFRIVATNEGGTSNGTGSTFATPPQPGGTPPTAITGGVSEIGADIATLTGSVNPNGSPTFARVEFGTSPAFGRTTAEFNVGATTVPVPIEVRIDGLSSATRYYWRVVARSTEGTGVGAVQDFVTASGALNAVDDEAFTAGRQPMVIDVLANDTGADRSVLRVLEVSRPSAGRVASNSDGTLTYSPSAAFGRVDTFTYSVGDDAGNISTATVTVRDTFRAAAGNYTGLVGSNESNFSDAGSLMLLITRHGTFTGNLELAGIRHPLKGELSADGTATVKLWNAPQSRLLVSMQLELATGQLTGTIVSNEEVLAIEATRVPFAAAINPAPQAGRYTLLLPPVNDDILAARSGFGYATMKITPSGAVTITGRTGKGARFSAHSFIGSDNRFPLYAITGLARPGSLHGWIAFETVAETSDCHGTLGFALASKPAHPAPPSSQLVVIGSRYIVPPAGTRVLDFPSGANNAVLQFGGSAFELPPAAIPATLTASTITAPGGKLSGVWLDLNTGFFSGNAAGIADVSAARFSGVVFQRQNLGAGIVKTPGGRGWLRLEEGLLQENTRPPTARLGHARVVCPSSSDPAE